MLNHLNRKLIAALLAAAMLLSVPVYAADSGAGTMTDAVRTFIAHGLTYYTRSYTGDGETRQRSVSLEVSADSEVYPIVMACDTIWGGMTMDAIIGYAQQQGYTVVGAVNTAFFNNPGVPIGIVVEDGVLKSSPNGLHAFAIMEDGTYYIARDPQVELLLSSDAWGEEVYVADHLNKLFDANGLYLYSSAYSTVSTRIDDKETVWAVRLLIEEGTVQLNGEMKLTVSEILPETKAEPIGEEYMVLTASVDGPYADLWQEFSEGDSVTLKINCADEQLAQAEYVTGCGDILVEDGHLADSTDWMHYIGDANPRTLVGWRADGTLVLYVAEGRNPGTADGLTLQMAAEEMLRQGCVYAVNMDGGGSSILGLRMPGEYTIEERNRLSAGAQRQCASYLLLVTDGLSDGSAKYWHLRQNHLRVLPGQKLELDVFGTDAALLPAKNNPETLLFADERGILRGNEYVAPNESGTYRVNMWGSNGFGEGEIEVVAHPDTLKITDMNGRALHNVMLEQGETLHLKVVATHEGEVIPADATVIRYEWSGSLGKLNEDNLFVADGLIGTRGTISMCVGDYTQQVRVTIVNSRTNALANRMKTALDFLYK